MSHMPRRMRSPRSVTVLIWKGPGRFPVGEVRTIVRQYRRAAMTGQVVVSVDWDVREVSRRFGGLR